jgi:hypothetical protein
LERRSEKAALIDTVLLLIHIDLTRRRETPIKGQMRY